MRTDRQQEVAGHSRRVAFLRVCLPLAALTLIMILIWMPNDDAPEAPQSGVAETGGESLKYSGRTDDGSVIDVVSASFLKGDELALIQRISARMQNPDGSRHEVLAQSAETKDSGDYIDLKGGAVLQAGGEFRVRSDGFRLSLNQSALHSLGAVTFEFDGGSGQAGSMRIVRRESGRDEADSWSSIEFTNGVEVTFVEFPQSEL
ncbi:MAG: LPS export ABC transporter periplasmic protein LptC [Rhodobacteraceae bacterium]|nr:LPS export ABC transporter periplasmic protein LptC [Paracoccaceae bacterium]